jgi:hypothetical protein
LKHEPFVNAIGINHACELTSNLQWWSSIAHISLGCMLCSACVLKFNGLVYFYATTKFSNIVLIFLLKCVSKALQANSTDQ